MKETAYLGLIGLILAVGAAPPHIIFVFFDDLGWFDVGYHGSEFYTPTIDKLAAEGVKLENYYVQPLCSPSRSQFFTGRYQTHTGVKQYPVFQGADIGGVPLSETIMPEVLKRANYRTHMIGKWHLGHSSLDYLPTGRGFETFLGYYLGRVDDHFHHHTCLNGLCGYDLHDDVGSTPRPAFALNGTYSTTAFQNRAVNIIERHDPSEPLFIDISFTAAVHVHSLQAPQKYIDMYPNIEDENRKMLGAMISAGDDAVLAITEALKDKGMWDNTVFIFSSDNGGHYPASNAPLRGHKFDYWDGGIKGTCFVNSPLLEVAGVHKHGLMHISDWLPTFAGLAGVDVSDLELDGHDIWPSISWADDSSRTEVLHHIDNDYPLHGENLYPEFFDTRVQASLSAYNWKILTGKHDTNDENEKNLWLFDIEKDPTESIDVSAKYPKIVEHMLKRLAYYNSTVVPQNELPMDVSGADPRRHNGAWFPWL